MRLQILKLCDCGKPYVADKPFACNDEIRQSNFVCPSCGERPVFLDVFDIPDEKLRKKQ